MDPHICLSQTWVSIKLSTFCAEGIIIYIYSVVQSETHHSMIRGVWKPRSCHMLDLYNLYIVTGGASHCEEDDIVTKHFMFTTKMNYHQGLRAHPITYFYQPLTYYRSIQMEILCRHHHRYFSILIYSMFLSEIYGLILRILCLYFLYHIVMWLWHWSKTALSQMGYYISFHIGMKNDYWAWIYTWPCSCG